MKSKATTLYLLLAATGSAAAQSNVVLETGTSYTIESAAAAVSGGSTPMYQWYRDGSPIAGATATSYTVPTAEAAGTDVEFKRAAYVDGCDERKFSNAITITWCNALIGGVCWADANVAQPGTFAARPDMYTEYYQWNRAGKAWATTGSVSGWTANITTAGWTSTPCPKGWRLPTKDEFVALGAASSRWVDAGTWGGAVGGRYYGRGAAAGSCQLNGSMVGCIFLPASDNRDVSGTIVAYTQGAYGAYWSSTSYDATQGYMLTFAESTASYPAAFKPKTFGVNVRCVR